MRITFKSVFEGDGFEGWELFPGLIQNIIKEAPWITRVGEVGAGANPSLSQDFVTAHGLSYRAMDADPEETGKTGRKDAEVFDICVEHATLPGSPFDLICSRMSAEHFYDARTAHENIFRSLAPGGIAVHSFATMYSLPYVLNVLLPESITDHLLRIFHPRIDEDKHGKFHAYYSRCRGPLKGQIRFLTNCGFEILEYRGFFGHFYYQDRLSLLHAMEKAKSRVLTKHPVAALTSYATVVLRKPDILVRNNWSIAVQRDNEPVLQG
jgi:SAM-dependent methyltransferase